MFDAEVASMADACSPGAQPGATRRNLAQPDQRLRKTNPPRLAASRPRPRSTAASCNPVQHHATWCNKNHECAKRTQGAVAAPGNVTLRERRPMVPLHSRRRHRFSRRGPRGPAHRLPQHRRHARRRLRVIQRPARKIVFGPGIGASAEQQSRDLRAGRIGAARGTAFAVVAGAVVQRRQALIVFCADVRLVVQQVIRDLDMPESRRHVERRRRVSGDDA